MCVLDCSVIEEEEEEKGVRRRATLVTKSFEKND
jgi:hypothetical protein